MQLWGDATTKMAGPCVQADSLELIPLADSLLAIDNLLSGLTWLYMHKKHIGSADDLLRRLGRGEVELTHEASIPSSPASRRPPRVAVVLTKIGRIWWSIR